MTWLWSHIWPVGLAAACALAVTFAGREWSADLPGTRTRPPSRWQAAKRHLHRFQLQRPALAPVAVTLVALAGSLALRVLDVFPHGAEHGGPDLVVLSESFALGMLTVFTLLAGVVAGFTFVVIGTTGASFTPLLSDPAIRAPRFWWFLAFSLAGTCTSIYPLLSPPRAQPELIVPVLCFVGALFALGLHLRSVSQDANPAALMRRLVDNDTPPVGFHEWAQGRPVQVGLATVRGALDKRDGPTAAAVTAEVVRACAHFQGVVLRVAPEVLRDPDKTWGVEYISQVQSEFQQWVDELARAEVFTPAAFEATGQLLAYPIVWETTLAARLGTGAGSAGDASAPERDDAVHDLMQPLRLLLGATRAAPAVGRPARQAGDDVRQLTLRTACLGGAMAVIGDAISAAEREAVSARPARVTPAMSERIAADLAVIAARLAVEYVAHIRDVGPIDRYERHLLHSANQALVRRYAGLWRRVAALARRSPGESDETFASPVSAEPMRGQSGAVAAVLDVLDRASAGSDEQGREFLTQLAWPLREAAQRPREPPVRAAAVPEAAGQPGDRGKGHEPIQTMEGMSAAQGTHRRVAAEEPHEASHVTAAADSAPGLDRRPQAKGD